MNVKKLKCGELLELFEEYVIRNHYDPVGEYDHLVELPYAVEDLRNEIKERLFILEGLNK